MCRVSVVVFSGVLCAGALAQIPEDYVESEGNRQVLKMSAPTQQVCEDFSRRGGTRCPVEVPSIPQSRRALYFQYVLEAANGAQGVPPAFILSSIAVETSFRGARSENETEKQSYENGGGNRSYRWGKGIGMFGHNNAVRYGLDWDAPRPETEDACWTPEYNRDREDNELWPIWSPRGAILAKTQFLREFWDRQFRDQVRDDEGDSIDDRYRVDHTYRFNEAHMVRYVIGMYNRGLMPINSLTEGYRQNLRLAREYIQAWHIPRLDSTTPSSPSVGYPNGFPILRGEYINRCHVAKVNRVCGLNTQGYMAAFEPYFEYRGGQWRLK